ncbi:hypothetical protein R1sor_015977 [Riccia sorocarpa]|uniref:Calcyclin-binding protein n=1 Tax=Riccia sorocarpa TaxID=122646 RepID=A0ABD3HE31_9MARC
MAEDDHYDADLEELQALLAAAKRPRVQAVLRQEIETLKKSREAATEEHAATSEAGTALEPMETEAHPPPVKEPEIALQPLQKTVTPLSVQYTTLDRFSYDQELDKLKIYIFLEESSQDKVEASFKNNSFDVKIHDVGGKNYRCAVPRLHKAIVPESCSVVVKPKRIIINLRKAEKNTWSDIHYKEDKFKTPKPSEDKDPMAGIMDLMKNLYEEGDDDMKRTIAKAWSESRSGKTSDSKFGGDLSDSF